MWTYRRLVILTVFVVVTAGTLLPAQLFYRHWEAVVALEGRKDVDFYLVRPPFADWVSARLGSNDNGYARLGAACDITFYEEIQARDMRRLQSVRGLEWASFEDVAEDAWQWLPPQLTHLEFRSPIEGVTLPVCRRISKLSRLKCLTVSGAQDQAWKLSSLSQNMPSLTTLRLRQFQDSPEALNTILTHTPILEALQVYSEYGLTDADIEQIARHPKISRLDLQHNSRRLTKASLATLAKMSKLKLLLIGAYYSQTGTPDTIDQGTKVTSTDIEKLQQLRPDLVINPPSHVNRDTYDNFY